MSKQGSNKPTESDDWKKPHRSRGRVKGKFTLEYRVDPAKKICRLFGDWSKWKKYYKKYKTAKARQEAMDKMNRAQDLFQYRIPEGE